MAQLVGAIGAAGRDPGKKGPPNPVGAIGAAGRDSSKQAAAQRGIPENPAAARSSLPSNT